MDLKSALLLGVIALACLQVSNVEGTWGGGWNRPRCSCFSSHWGGNQWGDNHWGGGHNHWDRKYGHGGHHQQCPWGWHRDWQNHHWCPWRQIRCCRGW